MLVVAKQLEWVTQPETHSTTIMTTSSTAPVNGLYKSIDHTSDAKDYHC
jgi:hypothetical protein